MKDIAIFIYLTITNSAARTGGTIKPQATAYMEKRGRSFICESWAHTQ